jgi:Pyruvate/2-oxoacid:ferredoxin oxidoreductase gamma subunit/GNAT superfamily N-acetyltransferase
MTARDAAAVSALFRQLMTELKGYVPDDLRENYCRLHDENGVREALRDERSVMLVAGKDASIAGFLLGRTEAGIGTIHWLRTHPEFRDQGYGHSLHFAAMDEFKRRGCFKAVIWVFPDAREIIDFYAREGFVQGELISGEYFGIALRQMEKFLREPKREETTCSITLLGTAGQGIKVMSHALAAILASMGKHVALTVTYPSSVRAGVVRGDLTYADTRVEMPFVEKADLLLQLAPVKKGDAVKARRVIRDREAGKILSDEYRAAEGDVEEHDFRKAALEEFGSPLFVNMVALGKLLRHLGVDVEKLDFSESLPAKYLDQNIRAIKYGYAFRDE